MPTASMAVNMVSIFFITGLVPVCRRGCYERDMHFYICYILGVWFTLQTSSFYSTSVSDNFFYLDALSMGKEVVCLDDIIYSNC